MKRRIRSLINGLTLGNHIYNKGEILEERHCSSAVHQYASGQKLLMGERVLEYFEAEPMLPESSAPVAQLTVTPEEPPPESQIESLEDLILTMVAEGQSKTAISETLGGLEEWTHREVRAEFDRLLQSGRIAQEDRGAYRVVD